MAITRIGFVGQFMAYIGFQPKSTQVLYSVPDVDETSIVSRSPVRTILSRNPIRTVESE